MPELLCAGELLCEPVYYASAYLPLVFALMIPVMFFLRGRKKQACLSALALVSSAALSEGLKYVFNVPRTNITASSPSFPSSHASISFSEARVLKFAQKPERFLAEPKIRRIFVPNRILFVLGFVFAAFVAFGRVYTGFHSWQDVIAGAVLGYIIAEIIMREGSRFIHEKKKSFIR